MNKLIVISTLIIYSPLFAQKKLDYKVFQFMENGSLNGHISQIVEFYSNGKKKYEETIDYKTTMLSGFLDSRTTFYYNDTLLIKEFTEFPNAEDKLNDSSKIFYQYENRLLKKEIHYKFNRSMITDKEFGDCLLDESDFESEPSWKKKAEIYYHYDSKGRKIEYYAPEVFWTSRQNRYLYFYNDSDQLVKQISLDHDEHICTTYYDYVENGVDFYVDWDKEKKISNKSDWPRMDTQRFYYDEQKRLIRKIGQEMGGIPEAIQVDLYYDSINRLIKTEVFGENGEKQVTHKYIYSE